VEKKNDIFYSLLQVLTIFPYAASFALKDRVFELREEEGLELFIVNSHGSFFQFILQPVFIPICVSLGVTNNTPIIDYTLDGLKCFVGNTPNTLEPETCNYAYVVYSMYIVINVTYNVLLLYLVKYASSLFSFMTSTIILPLSMFLFLIPWPIIKPAEISTFQYVSLITIITGLCLYQLTTKWQKENDLPCCSTQLNCFKKGEIEIQNTVESKI